MELTTGLLVHPTVTDCGVGPFGHEELYFPGPAVVKLALGGRQRLRAGLVAFGGRCCGGGVSLCGAPGKHLCFGRREFERRE